MVTKNTGVKNNPNEVTPSMPENTGMPIASASGSGARGNDQRNHTMMKANEVMRIGRSLDGRLMAIHGAENRTDARRKLHDQDGVLASKADEDDEADLGKDVLSEPLGHTPAMAESRHMGTIRITASGSAQLSYCAERIRNTNITQIGNTISAVLPAVFCWIREIGRFVAKAVRQRVLENPLDRGGGLTGRDARGALTVDVGRQINVVV